MELDLQNKPHQTEYLDSQTEPRFSIGRQLANLITSCGILDRAWQEICSASKDNVEFFWLKKDADVAYVTFPSFSSTTEDFVVKGGGYGEYSIQKEVIFSACLRGDADKPAFVHKGAFNRFQRILDNSDFKDKMKGSKANTIIFVGHSMGGAVATLATLYYLQMKVQEKSYFCITFGSPLVGNAILGEAIGLEDWTGKFCHVVSKYDVVPRMLLAPFESIAEPLNVLVPRWGSIMRTDCVAVPHPSLPRLLDKVLPYISDPRSPFRPFGTYMFCSTQGAACIDNSEAVLKMLHFNLQGMSFDQLAGNPASDHTGYGQMLEAITKDFLIATPIASNETDSFKMGIVLELEAMAIGPQENPHACSALREAGKKKNLQDMNIEKLNEDLSKVQSSMAELEGYKALCKERSGYYDSFKKDLERKEFHVNLALKKLTSFWKDIVELEEKHAVPCDFRCQNKWINAGTAYRRLVEPLEIARYYRTRKNNESYLSDEVRPYHHRVLQKWMEDKEKTRIGRGKKGRSKFASLTVDSCFWANVEDACQALPCLPQEQNRSQVWRESRDFENYIWNMISDKSISEEVFLKESSFMIWWEQYSSFASNSELISFMKNEGWKVENSQGAFFNIGKDLSK